MKTAKTIAMRTGASVRFYLAVVLAALLMAPTIVSAQSTDLFSDATTSVNDMTTKYTALLKVLFGGLVIAGIVFGLVKRGTKKATG